MSISGARTIPWKLHGWSERDAAAHLLDRFGFGARAGEVDTLVARGFERWFDEQLADRAHNRELDKRLAELDLLDLPARRFADVFPNGGVLVQELRAAGILDADTQPPDLRPGERARLLPKVLEYMTEKGYRHRREYARQLLAQKLTRALYSPNVLHEVLTDFWFNHFNVSLTDNQCAVYVLAYERDAIRPYVAGEFRDLLGATAKHPAMLHYLDNANSTADSGRATTLETGLQSRGRGRHGRRRAEGLIEMMERRRRESGRPAGLNENYARELMELHTLGVDGGYDQRDVIEVARAFTGWTVYPRADFIDRAGDRFDRALDFGVLIADEGFLFRADVHDAERKHVLGRELRAGRGVEDGEEVLDLLAGHPSTARHLARKLAVRFVSDEAGDSIVGRLAERFTRSRGDLGDVLSELVRSPEFWDRAIRRQKIKSPFELAVSALRSLEAEVKDPRDVGRWLERMGQPLYQFDAPTGYPDRAEFWVSAGALLNRMNFGLTLGAGGVRGVDVDLLGLNDRREPESRVDALEAYTRILLPERDFDPEPLLALTAQPELAARVREGAGDRRLEPGRVDEASFLEPNDGDVRDRDVPRIEPQALEQVVGVLLGSPEFQRR